MFNEYNIRKFINILNKYFYFLIIQNSDDISNKLIFYYVLKVMKKNVNLKPSQ